MYPHSSIDQQADDIFDRLPCHSHQPYPSTDISTQNEKIANLLLAAYGGGDTSELTAITQYLSHSYTIDDKELADRILCIALVEMHHLDMIGGLIESLGGTLRFWHANHSYWNAGTIEYGISVCEKLSLDILSEQEAIHGYEEIIRELQRMEDAEAPQVQQVIERILEDEKMHLAAFTDLYHRYCKR